MTLRFPKLSPSWNEALKHQADNFDLDNIRSFLHTEEACGHEIYPPQESYFAALDRTAFHDVKAVIIGQDPYHGPGQANGLSFSVARGVPIPKSLHNIFKELESDLGFERPTHGCLEAWADRGVLMLNTVLSVRAHMAASHAKKGWETFTDSVVRALNDREKPIAFVLWGKNAQDKAWFVDRSRHLALQSSHPSPLAAYRGFFGSRPFSKVNEFLEKSGIDGIDWSL